MIKPEDLRIGNWVEHYGETITVDGIDDIDVFNKKCGEIPLHSITPIPLTEKILMDCGFENKRGCFNLDRSEQLGHNFGDFAVSVYDITQIKFWRGDRYCGVVHCQYLHELQNLFYALTKTELIIKL